MEFDDVGEGELGRRLDEIRTDFNISNENAEAIDRAVEQLVVRENKCINRIRDLLVEKDRRIARDTAGVYCKWRLPQPGTEGGF
jgi:hypothetical protein